MLIFEGFAGSKSCVIGAVANQCNLVCVDNNPDSQSFFKKRFQLLGTILEKTLEMQSGEAEELEPSWEVDLLSKPDPFPFYFASVYGPTQWMRYDEGKGKRKAQSKKKSVVKKPKVTKTSSGIDPSLQSSSRDVQDVVPFTPTDLQMVEGEQPIPATQETESQRSVEFSLYAAGSKEGERDSLDEDESD